MKEKKIISKDAMPSDAGIIKNMFVLIGLVLSTSCAEQPVGQFDFLTGTWKVEGKEQYEAWVKESHNELSGHVYANIDRQIKILESIAIKKVNDQFIYEATVPDQNDGQTIQFILNEEVKTCFSFENPGHDFPKKIQYCKKSDSELDIHVLGEEGEGYNYTLIRQ